MAVLELQVLLKEPGLDMADGTQSVELPVSLAWTLGV